MNWIKIFEAQATLDNHIYTEKGLAASDVFDKKITALNTEIGECANEWRVFKYWSEDQEPRSRKRVICEECVGSGNLYWDSNYVDTEYQHEDCPDCKGVGKTIINPLLEEYVDGLHFVISLGVDVGVNPHNPIQSRMRELETTEQSFNYIQKCVSDLWSNIHFDYGNNRRSLWEKLHVHYMDLGNRLGFTEEQIEAAYYDKNQINHERQNNSY